MRRRTRIRVAAQAALAGFFWASLPVLAPAQDLPASQVFVNLGQRPDAGARAEYLRLHAGRRVEGTGNVEAVLPRSYYDTSVPHTNPAVALLHVGSGRKVVCGLPRLLSPEEMREYPEGSPVLFSGSLADAQDWGEWSTLYLSNCSLARR
ncbi:MAG: hypothetical protein AB1578_09575 [Thermodesulfobacteriota bacterium]